MEKQNVDLQALERKVQLLKIQQELQAQFEKNLKVMKAYFPNLYSIFRNYQPLEYQLQCMDDLSLNLVSNKSGECLYPTNAKNYCSKQLAAYLNRVEIMNTKTLAPEHFFDYMVRNMILKKQGVHAKLAKNKPGLFMLIGLGMGYLLPQVLNKLKINNLIIFEPNYDFFYAALHTIDWAAVCRHFTPKHRGFFLWVDKSMNELPQYLRFIAPEIGKFNCQTASYYQHLAGERYSDFIEKMKAETRLSEYLDGFFEDELMSIAHTANNLNNAIPILNTHKNHDRPYMPAIVVGNGPSLDGLLPLLKECQEKAVIFSCGTSTSTLRRAGIKPDFHVEMERGHATELEVEKGTTKDYRKGITLLALNSVIPTVFALFDEAYMAKKPTDAGAILIDHELSFDTYLLSGCNPTCTNTGLSFAVALGFTEVYLFGVDLGMVDESKHHASSSAYYAEKDEEKIKQGALGPSFEVAGNFEETVLTYRSFELSKVIMEGVLAKYPTVKAYNPNNGAKIIGAITIQPEDIEIEARDIDKQALINEVKSNRFTHYKLDTSLENDYILNKYFSKRAVTKKSIKLPKKIKPSTDLAKLSYEIWQNLRKIQYKSPMEYALLNGSLSAYLALVYDGCYHAQSQAQRQANYEVTRKGYHLFLTKMFELLEYELLHIDNLQRVYEAKDYDF